MSELFVVWLTTTGAFGLSAKTSAEAACSLAEQKHGQVFRIADPGWRYSIACHTPGCNFPGWVTIPVQCAKVPESSSVVPAHWEAR